MHYNCLIVDDETELAKMTAEYFRMFDVSTEFVDSAASCLSFFDEGNTADLILLDINLGDGFVLLSAFLLGPSLGTAAAGIGSALADLLSGYPLYAAGTLVIKALMALIAATLCRRLGHGGTKSRLVAAVAAELWMALGYFAYSALCLGYGLAAAAEIPGNLCQGAAGVAVAAFLTPALMGSHEIREMLDKARRQRNRER